MWVDLIFAVLALIPMTVTKPVHAQSLPPAAK
jgi:hypothetical protein